MKTKTLKWLLAKLFPTTIEAIRQEVRTEYFRLGVRIEVYYKKFEPSFSLQEAIAPQYDQLKMVKQAYIADGYEEGVEV